VAVRPVGRKELMCGPAVGRRQALNWSSGAQVIRVAVGLLQQLKRADERRIVFGDHRGEQRIQCLMQAPTGAVGRKQMGLDVAWGLHLEGLT
jgi:hypothetical protein